MIEAASRFGGETAPSPFDAFARDASPLLLQVLGVLFTAIFMAGSFLVYLAIRRYGRTPGCAVEAPWGLRVAYAVFIHWLAIGVIGGVLIAPSSGARALIRYLLSSRTTFSMPAWGSP